MKYMLLNYANVSKAPDYTPEQQQAAMQSWYAFHSELEAAGVLLHNEGLHPVADATTVRVRNGKTLTTDGPFAETHEQLGSYFMIECSNLDEALAWAAKDPGAKFGSVEVRPVMSFSQE
jgi:hypothetical protein